MTDENKVKQQNSEEMAIQQADVQPSEQQSSKPENGKPEQAQAAALEGVKNAPSEAESSALSKDKKKEPLFKNASWYDAVVIVLLAMLSLAVGGVLAFYAGDALGWERASDALRASVTSEVVEYVAFLDSRHLAVNMLFATIIGFILVAAYARIKGWRRVLVFRAPGWASPIRLLCGYLLLWAVSIAVEPVAELLPGSQDSLGGGGWLVVSAVLIAPLFEEVIFRGYIAGSLRSAYGGVVAWLFSSLFFGLMHMQPSVIVSATCSGLVLGYFYLRYRSLVIVIMLHAMNNLTACFLKTIELDDVPMRVILGGGRLYWVVYGVSVAIAVLMLWRMAVQMWRLKSDNYQAKK